MSRRPARRPSGSRRCGAPSMPPWAHAVAAVIEEAPGEKRWRAPQPAPPHDRPRYKPGLHGLEQLTIEDRLVVTMVNLTTVDHLADVEAVLEQIGQRSHPE